MLRNMHDSTYIKIFVHHEGKPTVYKFSIALRKCNYLDSLQIYKRHFNFMPQHVLSRNFRKNRNSGWLINILQCNLWAS